MPSSVLIGVEIGQRRSPSAICVAESELRYVEGAGEYHFEIRLLERLEPGTKYPALAGRLAEIESGVRRLARDSPVTVFVNATGFGESLIEFLDSRIRSRVLPVFFNHGDRRVAESDKITLGKAFLVGRLQVHLQTGRLHLPRTPQTTSLAQELTDYEINVASDANDRYGAFRVGSQDDLVTALGLAVQVDRVARCGASAAVPGW